MLVSWVIKILRFFSSFWDGLWYLRNHMVYGTSGSDGWLWFKEVSREKTVLHNMWCRGGGWSQVILPILWKHWWQQGRLWRSRGDGWAEHRALDENVGTGCAHWSSQGCWEVTATKGGPTGQSQEPLTQRFTHKESSYQWCRNRYWNS